MGLRMVRGMVKDIGLTALQRITDSVALGIFAVDKSWNITFFNREAERISGYERHEVIGMKCWEVFANERCNARCYMRQAMHSGRNVVKARVEILNRNRRRILLEITAAVLRDDAGEVIGGVESFIDLTARQALEKQVRDSYKYFDIIGRDKAMRQLFRTVDTVARTETTLLLQGETGTGKDLLARVIHNASLRTSSPYIKVNCAAIPGNLLESELFGYRKGAFTDAKKDKPGLLVTAQGGTVFLDEIADVPKELQAKLFQVLDEGSYYPLGATVPEKIDVRIIAATNLDLAALVDQGEFRSDLYYRLRVVELLIPPLRDRRSDIPLLIEHFVDEFAARQSKHLLGLEPDAMQVLLNYDYPGNVRELRHIIEHGVILSDGDRICLSDLPKYLSIVDASPTPPETLPTTALQESPKRETRERAMLLEALQEHGWRMSETAKALGINRTTLWRRKKKHGL